MVLRAYGLDLSPRAVEILLRQALGERVSSDYDDGTHALVMLFGLGELVCDEHFDQVGLDAFLADARALADARLVTQSGNQS